MVQSGLDGELVVFPPWVIEHRIDPTAAPARGDSFAATLGATAVVTRGDIPGRGTATLADVLRGAPGIVLLESFGGFEPPRLLVRGSGLDSAPTSRGVALLVDGLPLGRADGSFHSGLLDPSLYSRLEVYRGTVHAALTPAVLGGVLNAVTSVADAPAHSVRLETGSFGARRGGFTTGVAAGAVTAHLASSFSVQDGYRPHSHQERFAGVATVRHEISPEHVLELSAHAVQLDYEVPGPLTLAAAQADPRSVSAAVLRDRPLRESALWRVSAQLKAGPDDRTLAVGVAAQRWRDDFRQLQANGETDATGVDLHGHLTLARKVWVGAMPHHLLARATVSAGRAESDRYLNAAGARGARFAELDLHAGTGAVSLEDLVWLRPELAFGIGASAVEARRAVDDAAGGFRVVQARDISPRLGLRWLAAPHLEFSAAVSRGVEPPTFDDLLAVEGTYPALRVIPRPLAFQHATTAEFGARVHTGRVSWNLTAYHGKWRGELLKLADAAGLPRGAVNAGRTIHAGLEAAARWRIVDGPHGLELRATAVWNHFRFDDDPVYGDNRLAGAPRQVGQAELLYAAPRGWSAGIGASWVSGGTPVDHANRMFYPGHALMNAHVAWDLGSRLRVRATVRNLQDRRHIASTAGVLDLARNPAATAIFLPGAGRSFTVGFEWIP